MARRARAQRGAPAGATRRAEESEAGQPTARASAARPSGGQTRERRAAGRRKTARSAMKNGGRGRGRENAAERSEAARTRTRPQDATALPSERSERSPKRSGGRDAMEREQRATAERGGRKRAGTRDDRRSGAGAPARPAEEKRRREGDKPEMKTPAKLTKRAPDADVRGLGASGHPKTRGSNRTRSGLGVKPPSTAVVLRRQGHARTTAREQHRDSRQKRRGGRALRGGRDRSPRAQRGGNEGAGRGMRRATRSTRRK